MDEFSSVPTKVSRVWDMLNRSRIKQIARRAVQRRLRRGRKSFVPPRRPELKNMAYAMQKSFIALTNNAYEEIDNQFGIIKKPNQQSWIDTYPELESLFDELNNAIVTLEEAILNLRIEIDESASIDDY